MRHMSFALTTAQVREQTKTVTRRLGWANAAPGMLVQPIVKGQGLKKGERVEKIGGPILIVDVRREELSAITPCDVAREGFAGMAPLEFAAMFCQHNGCDLTDRITRIEFEYVEAKQSGERE